MAISLGLLSIERNKKRLEGRTSTICNVTSYIDMSCFLIPKRQRVHEKFKKLYLYKLKSPP